MTVYTVHVAPMRHDDPRRSTRESRIDAAAAVANACRDAGLRVQIKTRNKATADAHAEAMRKVLEPIGREVYNGECMAVSL